MSLILVVDDDEDVLQTIQLNLTFHGHRVIAANSGREALGKSQQEHPDLVLLDMMMPEMDGLEVCRHLRAQPATANVPVLFLTANGTVEGRIAGFSAGANDYLVKPFDLRELNVRIQSLLQNNHTESLSALPTTLVVGELKLNCRTFNLDIGERSIQLTPIEYDLLHYLMSHPSEILSTEQLLRDVWHYADNAGKPELVRAHIKNLRNKIELDPKNPIYLKTVERIGYTIRTTIPSNVSSSS